MGRTIYFSDKEMAALRDTAGEWCSMMVMAMKIQCNVSTKGFMTGWVPR